MMYICKNCGNEINRENQALHGDVFCLMPVRYRRVVVGNQEAYSKDEGNITASEFRALLEEVK